MDYNVCRAAFVSIFDRYQLEKLHRSELKHSRLFVGFEMSKIKLFPGEINSNDQARISEILSEIEAAYPKNYDAEDYDPTARQHSIDWHIFTHKSIRLNPSPKKPSIIQDLS